MTRIAVVPNHIQSVPGGADIRISLFRQRWLGSCQKVPKDDAAFKRSSRLGHGRFGHGRRCF